MLEDLDKILNDVAFEEEKEITEDWWCTECEHGPMTEKDNKCTRCGTKNGKACSNEDLDGWNDEDIESEVEEIF